MFNFEHKSTTVAVRLRGLSQHVRVGWDWTLILSAILEMVSARTDQKSFIDAPYLSAAAQLKRVMAC